MLVMAVGANADVISGQGVMAPCWGWDFSEQVSLCYLENPDIILGFIVDPPLGLVIGVTGWASIVMLPDSNFEDLRYAPEDSTAYGYDLPALVNTTYVARTREGHFAKFRLLQLPYLVPIIEYVYQPDGSRRFFNEIGVEKSTWSAVKALFR
ncbi:MAG: hypothetical protein ABR899_07955 [Candidatus Krumholzibacteriaceae bacterium]